MFGLSLSKVLVIVVVAVVVWLAVKYFRRIEQLSQIALDRRSGPKVRRDPGAAEDIVKCRVCGAYVAPRGAGPCERKGCPWG